ncbi:MAG: hypothetical protein V1712_03920 [Patescibacteria group bacterium]
MRKYILGLITISAILLFGTACSKLPQPKTLPPTTHGSADSVSFTINDTVPISPDGYRLPYSIYNIIPDEPISLRMLKIQHSCDGELGHGIDQYCKEGKIVTESVGGPCSDALREGTQKINQTFTWDLRECVDITELCEGKTIKHEIKRIVPDGKYQIKVDNKVIKELTVANGKVEEDNNPFSAGEDVYTLISRPIIQCVWMEQSSPYANMYFSYQKNGVVKYLETLTSCADFPNTSSLTADIIGEKITLFPDAIDPILITRENGDQYSVTSVSSIPSVWFLNRHLYYDANAKAGIKINHQTEFETACNAIDNVVQKDNCLFFYNQL